jgi:long-chain acyl-CoA synthetase
MDLISKLTSVWRNSESPFLIYDGMELRFDDILSAEIPDLSPLKSGSVVAIIGDFNPESIKSLLYLLSKGMIVVPLTFETIADHEYFFETACVDAILTRESLVMRERVKKHVLINSLRDLGTSGLVLFSSGTTGRPKAILHDMDKFLVRYDTPRPPLKAINFLLFDHIGGINTLLHNLFNRGTVVAPVDRSVGSILDLCDVHEIEVLPTTPTFLRMLLLSGLIEQGLPKSLKIITYGTERMDQPTLDRLCEVLPNVDFRQTFGMSELGIVRVKSESRDSLFMKIGGEGVETRVIDNVLQIRSASRMLGYLNADSPFDEEGWYDTKDIVEAKDGFYKVVGRVGDLINVGGLKFMASEVERVILEFPGVSMTKVYAKTNPVTGQHAEATVQMISGVSFDKASLVEFLKRSLQSHMVPKRIKLASVEVGHRYKKL